jgi:multidrug resistance protein, MATE family
MPFVAAFQIADGLANSNGGCLRGMGRQHYGAVVNFVAYYLIALPCGIYLAFHGWGLAGLWAGNAGGAAQSCCVPNLSAISSRIL